MAIQFFQNPRKFILGDLCGFLSFLFRYTMNDVFVLQYPQEPIRRKRQDYEQPPDIGVGFSMLYRVVHKLFNCKTHTWLIGA